jgi:hypothetical protein
VEPSAAVDALGQGAERRAETDVPSVGEAVAVCPFGVPARRAGAGGESFLDDRALVSTAERTPRCSESTTSAGLISIPIEQGPGSLVRGPALETSRLHTGAKQVSDLFARAAV